MKPSNADVRYVYGISAVAALAGLLFGFDIAVINGALVYLRDAFHLSEHQTELAASSLLFGCIGGAAVTGALTDRFGRRRLLVVVALLFGLSSLGSATAQTFMQFQISRLVGGLSIGAGSMLAPMYIAEAAPARLRGRLVSLNQMAIVTGILIAYGVNYFASFHGASGWRWMFAFGVIPSAFLLVGMLVVPESPRWLVEQNRENQAMKTLSRIEGEDAEEQLKAIQDAVAQETSSFRDLLAPNLRRPLLLVTGLAVFSQITGMNTVLFYGSLIWEQHVGGRGGHSAAIGANLLIGVVNFSATLLALWLVERSGRKPLLLFSCAAMAFGQLGLGLSFLIQPTPVWLALTCMLVTVAVFAVGLGPCTWVLMAELLPTRVRGRAMSVANVALWSASFALTVTFLSLSRLLSAAGAFCLYSLMCVITFMTIWKWVPETKGKSLEEIESLWTKT